MDRAQGRPRREVFDSTFLRAFSVVLLIAAVAVFILPSEPGRTDVACTACTVGAAGASSVPAEQALLESVEAAGDHIEPEELADAILRGEPNLVVVDVRSPAEYAAYHIPGALNVPLPELVEYLAPYKNRGRIVLYSSGMTHPAQARDALARLGFQNAYMLTDGLQGFLNRCLKPVSLRREPLAESEAQRVRAWRAFFLGSGAQGAKPAAVAVASPGRLPGLVTTAWLAENLGRPGLKIIDVRPQPHYNTSHVPGSMALNPESLRGVVDGVPSVLLPANVLAAQLSLAGIRPTDTVVIVPGDKVRDATLVGMALDRVGQARWALLDGGFDRWVAEKRPVDNALPAATESHYAARAGADGFTVDYRTVLADSRDGRTVIVDTRPVDYFTGKKSDEARAGHIPGAVNRPFSEDLGKDQQLKPAAELAAAYAKLIPSKDTPVVVHCRTGHQASQTYFVLKHALGYPNVKWYDGSWTEWAARPELPVAN